MLDLLADGTQLTEAQKRAGLDAAIGVFRRHNEDPLKCYRVYGYAIRGPVNLSKADEPLIEVWEEAESSALAAAFGDRCVADVELVYREDRTAAAA